MKKPRATTVPGVVGRWASWGGQSTYSRVPIERIGEVVSVTYAGRWFLLVQTPGGALVSIEADHCCVVDDATKSRLLANWSKRARLAERRRR